MKRFEKRFAELRARREGAFVAFAVLGDPDFSTSKKILEALGKGADMLELGFPFSDPIADGKRIQAADERALRAKITPQKCLLLIRHIRKKHPSLPIGLLLYYNLVYSNGEEQFLRGARKAGVDAVLIADMPVEESGKFNAMCRKAGLEQVFTVAPTTGKGRMRRILAKCRGFVYAVGVLGVTGERAGVRAMALGLVRRIKSMRGPRKLPVCVGFGISRPEHARKIISAGADGVIVGSAIEAVIEKNLGNKSAMIKKLREFCSAIKGATRI